jgi:hypothetical protein
MSDISNKIRDIIEDLQNPKMALENILLKTKVLAYQLKNKQLMIWVDSELGGYDSDDPIPDYRTIKITLCSYSPIYKSPNIHSYFEIADGISSASIQDRLLRNYPVLWQLSKLEAITYLNDVYLGLPLTSALMDIDRVFRRVRDEIIAVKVLRTDMMAIISSIKSNLLSLLLELNDELGDRGDLLVPLNKMNLLTKERLGFTNYNVENMSINNEKIKNQINSTGDNNQIHSGSGDNIQNFNVDSSEKIEEFISLLKFELETVDIPDEDKEDIEASVAIIETQLQREEPRQSVINANLGLLKDFLLGVNVTVWTPVLIEGFKGLMS